MQYLAQSKISIVPTLLFLVTNILSFSVHELAHAVTAYFFGINAQLFPFYTNISRSMGTTTEKAIVSLVGPFVSLIIGLTCWATYKGRKSSHLKLFFLYAWILGVSIFLGNLFSAAIAGDFHRSFILLGIPLIVSVAVTVVGLSILIHFMYQAGSHFLAFKVVNGETKNQTMLNTIIIPWILGTLLLIACYLPLPLPLIIGILSSSFFWLFSIIGAWKASKEMSKGYYQLDQVKLPEVVLFILCIVLVRLLTNGISFSS